jgi:hypothetical protein
MHVKKSSFYFSNTRLLRAIEYELQVVQPSERQTQTQIL